MTTRPTIQTIGERIKEAIADLQQKDEDQTITKIAGEIGVHPDTLIRYMNGTTKRGPTYRDVLKIASITGKPVEFFEQTEAVV